MKRWTGVWWPLAFGCGGALLVWAASLLIPDHYTSTAIIRLDAEPFPAADVIAEAYQEAVSRKALKNLIVRLNLYSGDRERLPLEDVIEAAKKDDIELDILPNHDVRVAFLYRDPAVAQAAAKSIMETMVAAADEHSQRTTGWGRLETKQAAGAAEASSMRLAFWRQPRYTSQGMLTVKKLDAFVADQKLIESRASKLEQTSLTRERLASLIAAHRLYGMGRDWDPGEMTEELRRDLRIERQGDSNIFKIRFTYPDARLAQATVSDLITRLIDENVYAPCQTEPESNPAISKASSSPGLDVERLSPRILSDNDLDTGGSEPSIPSVQLFSAPGVPFPPSTGRNTRRGCPSDKPWEHSITVLDTASLPEDSDGPARPILAVFGFFLGLGLWTALKD